MKKVCVLGSTGLIGHQVYNYLDSLKKYEMTNISYRKKLNDSSVLCDVRNVKKFEEIIHAKSPDIIVNCIGILINESEKNPSNSIYLNAYFPHYLMKLCNQINAKLIHVSTDCVFSGNKKTPYVENDYKDGKNIYAKTKGLGEIINEKHLTLRTSVIGPELKKNGEELFHWFMLQKNKVSGYKRAVWSGVTTIILAKSIEWAINNNVNNLYHITNNKSIDKFTLLKLIKKYTKKNIEIEPCSKNVTNKSFIDTRKEINFKIPSYEKMVEKMILMIKKNPEYYGHYNIK